MPDDDTKPVTVGVARIRCRCGSFVDVPVAGYATPCTCGCWYGASVYRIEVTSTTPRRPGPSETKEG